MNKALWFIKNVSSFYLYILIPASKFQISETKIIILV